MNKPTERVTRLLSIIQSHPGISGSEIARHLGQYRSNGFDGLRRLHARGLAVPTPMWVQTFSNGGGTWAQSWTLTAEGEALARGDAGGSMMARAVLAAVRECGALLVGDIATHTSLHVDTVRMVCRVLEGAGELESARYYGRPRYRLPKPLLLDDSDDDGWTPQPFVNPIRARALGIAA